MNKSLQAAMLLLERMPGACVSELVLTKEGAKELQEQIDRVDPKMPHVGQWSPGCGLEITVDHYMPENCGGVIVDGKRINARVRENAEPGPIVPDEIIRPGGRREDGHAMFGHLGRRTSFGRNRWG